MYSRQIKIQSYDVDRDGNLKWSSLMRHFQQIARENLDEFGMTYDFLRARGIVFVLTKYRIRVLDRMRADVQYRFTTSPCAIHGVSFIRDFLVTDDTGHRFAEASSTWIIIDYEKRSILRPSKLPLPIEPDDRLVDFLPERSRNPVSEAPDAVYHTAVTFSQLDSNNHLNNCNYADIMIDGMFENMLPMPLCCEIEMSYEHEAKCGSQLALKYYQESDALLAVCENQTDGNICFSAVIASGSTSQQ